MPELTIGGLTRTFIMRFPEERPAPLVLVLHGNHPGATGQQMREWTMFDKQTDFAIAYPDGVGGCWADGRGVTTADEAGVDDVAFLRAIIDWSAERHGTWPDRAVVAGVSNGAFMAHRLALEASDQVAVLAAVAGGMPARLHDIEPAHAVSALLIHGTADPISPIGGGFSRHLGPNGELRGRTLSLDETASRWRAIDRCPPDGSGIGGTRVTTHIIEGGGHTWPGGTAEEVCRFAGPLLGNAETRRIS